MALKVDTIQNPSSVVVNLTLDTSGNVTVGNALTVPSSSISGNLTFTGTGNRITGDFTNATVANRVIFQSSTTNGGTFVSAIPNGSGAQAGFVAYAQSDPANASSLSILPQSAASQWSIRSGLTGTGTYLPITFYTGGLESLRIDTSGNVGIGTSSPEAKTSIVSSAGAIGLTIKDANAGASNYLSAQYNGTSGLADIKAQSGGGSTQIAFSTSLSGTTAERMRIDSSGNVGIGTTDYAQFNRGLSIYASGGIYSGIQLTNTTTGNVGTAGTLIFTAGNDFNITNKQSGVIAFATANTERMRIDSSGRVTMPYQPCFWAYAGAGNPTLTGTATALVFIAAITNVGSYYSTANGRFTAPVAGTYLFNWTIAQSGATGGPVAYLGKNGTAVAPGAIAYSTAYNTASMSAIITLAASDYVQVLGQALNGVSPVIDMNWSSFSGHLIG